MSLRLQKGIEGVNFKDVAALIEAVGWGVRDPRQLETAFKRSETAFVSMMQRSWEWAGALPTASITRQFGIVL